MGVNGRTPGNSGNPGAAGYSGLSPAFRNGTGPQAQPPGGGGTPVLRGGPAPAQPPAGPSPAPDPMGGGPVSQYAPPTGGGGGFAPPVQSPDSSPLANPALGVGPRTIPGVQPQQQMRPGAPRRY